jgi:hypothetical protein
MVLLKKSKEIIRRSGRRTGHLESWVAGESRSAAARLLGYLFRIAGV